MAKRVVVGGALGEDAHVAGVASFLRLAEEAGWQSIYLGPVVSITDFLSSIEEYDPELVAVSYRLTPETGENLLKQFIEAVRQKNLTNRRFVFGGTPPVVDRAKKLNFFERCFSGGESLDEVTSYLKGRLLEAATEKDYPQTFVERLRWKAPRPLIRHHFGLPTVEETEEGIKKIAESMVLDVVSLGIDQDAQENFFHPERQDPRRKGAGGVPCRSADDYRRLYAASRRGNFPLMRAYSGTDDHLRLAELYVETIRNAWCATSLFWFNQLDRRGPLGLVESIKVHQELMRWHGERDIQVELNEPHHWGMRYAPDVVYVVTSFLSAYNAKKMGVRDYIAQYMFNSPPELSDRMDLAKVLACIELAESLVDESFRAYRQTRTGLLSHPVDPSLAKGHLGASVYLQMAVKPHIIHVVGFPEAHHATTAEELIQSCKIARRAAENALRGAPEMTVDPTVIKRKNELVAEARVTLEAIRRD
ncbi:MAG: cobalamin B12-binding domain-containing protein, partial [Thaumarchaeota archaeon]|nr:cobalamin B12-binding domain-containing protein [Nitrososphaerota archaeon]